MAPTDSTLTSRTGSFELTHSLRAYDKIPVYEYTSKRTGLTVVIAEVDGPVVNGFFSLATEAFDDDGIPHTLEHLIFLGSEDYPYKGVLDLLANRCLASGTNAWTDVDHTCYTMETAGSEGFLALMPIYLDHILYPILSEEAFITEVHHVTEEGEDAGVVYCEIQGRENSGESIIYLKLRKLIYPGNWGYSSETGGLMKNLRETLTNDKIKKYHKDFYRPENLKLIVTGKIKHDDLFRALEPIERKIISKGERGPFTRPWQSPVPPFSQSQDVVINYPSDTENNGIVLVGWRGPSAVNQIYELNACAVLLKYLTESSVSLLQKEFVEIDDPFASEVGYSLIEHSSSCLYLTFRNVPLEKIPHVKPKLDTIIQKVVKSEEIDLKRMKMIIKKQKLESLSGIENSPHEFIAYMIIGQMLYGNTKKDYEQRLNPILDFDRMDSEPPTFWLNLVKNYFMENNYVAIQALPSIEEKKKMVTEEKERIAEQVKNLGEEGLKGKGEKLMRAIEYNEREPPENMLTSVPIPNSKNVNYHEIVRYTSDTTGEKQINLKNTPVYTHFDHVKTSFVYMYVLMDTSKLSPEQRLYLPLLLEAMLESPIMREGKLVPYEEVVAQLQDDTVVHAQQIGLGKNKRFTCSSFSTTVCVVLQVEVENYEKGVNWLRELLYQTVFTAERLKIISMKMLNEVAEAKRNGRSVASYILKSLYYIQDSNVHANGIIKQQKFLSDLVTKFDLDDYQSSEVLEAVDTIRKIITDPSNVALYLAANLDNLKPDAAKVLDLFLPSDIPKPEKRGFNIVPDWKLLIPEAEGGLRQCLVGMGCLDSSFFFQSAASVNAYDDPDMPALLVYAQYLCQAEGPMWRQVRGKGLSYNYAITLRANEGLLYIVFAKATNAVGAYKETLDIVTNQITEQQWDTTLLESAKSSLIFEMIENESTIGNVISHSLDSYFYQIDYNYNRKLIDLIMRVTPEDLNRVGDKYIRTALDSTKVKTAVACDGGKANEIAEGFKKLNVNLQVFPSLEESFLNK